MYEALWKKEKSSVYIFHLEKLNLVEFTDRCWVGDGQGGLVCCSWWGHKELDMTKQLNWTEQMVWR